LKKRGLAGSAREGSPDTRRKAEEGDSWRRKENPHWHQTVRDVMEPWINQKGERLREFGPAFSKANGAVDMAVPKDRCTPFEIMGVCVAGKHCRAPNGAHSKSSPLTDAEAMALAKQLQPAVETLQSGGSKS